MKFLHAMIRVKNLEDSFRFYKDLIGLKEIKKLRLEDCTLYYLGNNENETLIELTHNDDIPSEGYENGQAFGHFAFAVDSLDEFSEKVKNMDYEFLYEPFILEGTGMKIAFMLDPDGNEIEIIEE